MAIVNKGLTKGPTIGTRRTKVELHRAAVRGWPTGPYKEIAKELLWLAKITIDDLAAAHQEIKNLRDRKTK